MSLCFVVATLSVGLLRKVVPRLITHTVADDVASFEGLVV